MSRLIQIIWRPCLATICPGSLRTFGCERRCWSSAFTRCISKMCVAYGKSLPSPQNQFKLELNLNFRFRLNRFHRRKSIKSFSWSTRETFARRYILRKFTSSRRWSSTSCRSREGGWCSVSRRMHEPLWTLYLESKNC